MKLKFTVVVFASLLVAIAAAWTTEDHEIFRLRDDVALHEGENSTFYSFVGVTRKATFEEINKAYRRKAGRIHPDKARQQFLANYGKPKPGEKRQGPKVHKQPSKREIDAFYKEASERFARLGVVANILRGADRERYDHFLDYGFPKWRGTGYYYKRYRPGLGMVLTGLFIFFGGAAHYGALVLGWRRQRDFVQRYIKHARKMAWGENVFVPGIDNAAPVAVPAVATNGNAADGVETPAMNRRQKRLQERENRKASKKGGGISADDIGEPMEPHLISGPVGNKKRVVAENGKVLIVDSAGNVFLEETTDEGETHEYLLDVNEIAKPSIYDTILFRLPVWAWRQFSSRVLKTTAEPPRLYEDELIVDNSVPNAVSNAAAPNPTEEVKRRRAKVRQRT